MSQGINNILNNFQWGGGGQKFLYDYHKKDAWSYQQVMLFWVQIFIVEKIQTDMRSKLKNDTKCASMVTEQNQEV